MPRVGSRAGVAVQARALAIGEPNTRAPTPAKVPSVTALFDREDEAQGLLDYLDASPTPYHAVEQAARRLRAGGFAALELTDPFPAGPGRHVVVADGALVAWVVPAAVPAHAPWRVVAAHTDSPTLRVKPRPDLVKAGWQMVGVEPYGGLLLNSWLDRDLGLAGRVVVRAGPGGHRVHLFHDRSPVLRVAQLAVHLDRQVNETGVVLDRQDHLVPLWGLGERPASVAAYLAGLVGLDPAEVLSWDAMAYDTQPAQRIGRERDLVSGARLDNLVSAYAAVRAVLAAADTLAGHRIMLVLFDHEEVGSLSGRGAHSDLLGSVARRVVRAAGGDIEDHLRAVAASVVASADMAHAVHPNYPQRSEPAHPVRVNAGPVLKVQSELRYASDAVGAAHLRRAAEQAGAALQTFVVRSDLPCGSTIGPITAARFGACTVDVGAPMLSMHSARELCGAQDIAPYAATLAAFLVPS